MRDKDKIEPIYNELRGFLSEVPKVKTLIASGGEVGFWVPVNKAIDELEKVTNKDYSRYRIAPEDRSTSGRKYLIVSYRTFRSSLSGLLYQLHDEYFPYEEFGETQMELFSQRPDIGMEDFCRQFYDSKISLKTTAAEGAPPWWTRALESVVEIDPSVVKTDFDLFREEMTALCFELFGLAWTHMFRGIEMETALWPQISFTRDYLEQVGHQNIWGTMLVFNQQIGRQRNHYFTAKSRPERFFEATLSYYNWTLVDHFRSTWSKNGKDGDCAARILNRVCSEGAWKESLIPTSLTATLAERLGWGADPGVVDKLRGFVSDIYVDAKDRIQLVELTFNGDVKNDGFSFFPSI